MVEPMDGSAPYAPPATVLQVIERYRDRGLQTPFTREVLTRAGVSESLANRTLQALKMLGLVDADGQPTETLRQYQRATQDEAKGIIGNVVRASYAQVFNFADPALDSPERVRDAFRSYEPRGQQERMITLFLGLCEYAGLIPEQPKRSQSLATRPRSDKPPAHRRSARSGKEAGQAPAKNADALPDGLPSAVEGLVRELAAIGPTWTRERRDQFMLLWDAVISYSYPPREDDEESLPDL